MTGQVRRLALKAELDRPVPRTVTAVIESAGGSDPAVLAIDEDATYADVRAQADALATRIDAFAPGPVAITLRSPVATLATLLAAARLGRPYAILDPTMPRAWRDRLADRLMATVDVLGDADAIVVEGAGPALAIRAGRHDLAEPDDPLYVAWTSGSGGIPKGVVHTHRTALTNARRIQQAFDVDAADRLLVLSPLGYVGAATPVLTAVVAGASVAVHVLAAEGATGLGAFVERTRPSIVHLTPGHLRAFTGRVVAASVRLVLVGGDRLTGADVAALVRTFPAADLVHRYNASETNWIAGAQIDPTGWSAGDPVPVGWPVPWLGVEVVDRERTPRSEPQAARCVGRARVTGEHLAVGYWGDRALTAEHFDGLGTHRSFLTDDRVRIDADGALTVIGRLSRTVKVRGVLVDLDAVERELVALPDVDEAAVVVDPAGRLVAFACGSSSTGARVRRAVAERVPAAMVPAVLRLVPELPRGPRGKVDYSRLASISPTPTPSPPARGVRESRIALAVADVLELAFVGRDDDLFELGADSLDVAELIERLTPILGRRLTTSQLLATPTPARLAAQSPPSQVERRDLLSVTDTGVGSVVLFPGGGGGEVGQLAALGRGFVDRRVLVCAAHGYQRRGRPDRTVEAMADRAAAALRAVDLSNPVTVIGQSSGGMVALEVARRLRDHDVAAVVLLDTDVPDDRGAADRVAGRVGQRAADLRVAHPRWPEAVVRLGARVRPRLALRIATAGIIMRKPSLQRYVFTAIRARALDRFVPTAYRGRVVLILAAERDDPALPVGSARVVLPARWQTVLGTPVECTVAPGSHATMTDEVNRAALVAVIERALGRVEATCEATYTASA